MCDTCNGLGRYTRAVATDHPDFGRAFDCPNCNAGQERTKKKAAKAFNGSGLPTRYQERTLADFDSLSNARKDGKALAIAAAHLMVDGLGAPFSAADIYAYLGYQANDTTPRWGIVLFGDYGTGKTSLAAAIANGFNGYEVVSARTIDLIKSVQGGYADNQAEAIIKRAIDAKLLILDECNLNAYTDNAREIIERIIRRRYDNAKPVILTVNVNQSEFETGWGVRIASCVAEMCHWVPVGGLPLRNESVPLVDPTMKAAS